MFADRLFQPGLGSLDAGVVDLHASYVIGASGAVASSAGNGVASVTKEATAGQYTLALQDSYQALLHASVVIIEDAATDPATTGVVCKVFSESVSSTSTPKVVLQFINTATGAAANPIATVKVLVKLTLKNSSI